MLEKYIFEGLLKENQPYYWKAANWYVGEILGESMVVTDDMLEKWKNANRGNKRYVAGSLGFNKDADWIIEKAYKKVLGVFKVYNDLVGLNKELKKFKCGGDVYSFGDYEKIGWE